MLRLQIINATCWRMWIHSLWAAASYSCGTCQTPTAADCTASATAGRFSKPALRRNDAERDSAPPTARRADSGNGSHMRGHGRPSTTSGGTTVMRTMCCAMCADSHLSAQSSNGRSSTTNVSMTPLKKLASRHRRTLPRRPRAYSAAAVPHTTRGSGSII